MMSTSNANIQTAKSATTFKDVAGLDEEREQFEEVVQFLRNPKKYEEMGAKIPKGILLNGEPGTGKTLLAKAIAGEAGVPFFQMSGSDFEEKFVGVGASKVRKLFAKAKNVAPAIIFIDEIDAVAQSRYGGRTYSEQTLNQLLTEMDGFSSSDSVIVIAATNRIDVLDPALLRPGRFDRHIFISKPDIIARKEILKIHARNKKLTADISLDEIAQKTVGFSGADLANILNEAAIYAVNQGKQYIDNTDISEAIARVLVGLEKKNVSVSEEDKKLTATHEAGHAIVSAVLRPTVKNFGISIVQRGNAGGYNYFDEPDAKYSRKEELKKQIAVLYGGRAAEEIILGDISSGASNDLERASKIVK
jgi:cell division protease FtsH